MGAAVAGLKLIYEDLRPSQPWYRYMVDPYEAYLAITVTTTAGRAYVF